MAKEPRLKGAGEKYSSSCFVPAVVCFIVKVSDKGSGLAVNREMDTSPHGNW